MEVKKGRRSWRTSELSTFYTTSTIQLLNNLVTREGERQKGHEMRDGGIVGVDAEGKGVVRISRGRLDK